MHRQGGFVCETSLISCNSFGCQRSLDMQFLTPADTDKWISVSCQSYTIWLFDYNVNLMALSQLTTCQIVFFFSIFIEGLTAVWMSSRQPIYDCQQEICSFRSLVISISSPYQIANFPIIKKLMPAAIMHAHISGFSYSATCRLDLHPSPPVSYAQKWPNCDFFPQNMHNVLNRK